MKEINTKARVKLKSKMRKSLPIYHEELRDIFFYCHVDHFMSDFLLYPNRIIVNNSVEVLDDC